MVVTGVAQRGKHLPGESQGRNIVDPPSVRFTRWQVSHVASFTVASIQLLPRPDNAVLNELVDQRPKGVVGRGLGGRDVRVQGDEYDGQEGG